jgi:hypothetical protein
VKSTEFEKNHRPQASRPIQYGTDFGVAEGRDIRCQSGPEADLPVEYGTAREKHPCLGASAACVRARVGVWLEGLVGGVGRGNVEGDLVGDTDAVAF